MFAIALTLVIAQATASPIPAPTVSPSGFPAGWTSVALAPGEYVHLTRAQADGSPATLVATKQLCDCQPIDLQAELAAVFLRTSRSATVKLDSIVVCGQPGQRLLVTGLADATHQNVEAIAFRQGGALYGMDYYFAAPAPNSADEATMLTLCPP